MKRASILIAGLSMSACATNASQDAMASAETSIPYVRSNGILEWKAEGDDALRIRSQSGDWYLVKTMGRCSRLGTALSLGFVTPGPDQLDRFGAILADGLRCPVRSVTRSGPPPEDAES